MNIQPTIELIRKIANDFGAENAQLSGLSLLQLCDAYEALRVSMEEVDCNNASLVRDNMDFMGHIDELRAKVDGLEKDAARYRNLRIWIPYRTSWADGPIGEATSSGEFDAALDAAMACGQVSHSHDDTTRLDFLDRHNIPKKMGWNVGQAPAGNVSVTGVIQLGGKVTSIREAIDAAMQKDQAGGV